MKKSETIEKIRKRYRKEWLLIMVDKMDKSRSVPQMGHVIAHSPLKRFLIFTGLGICVLSSLPALHQRWRDEHAQRQVAIVVDWKEGGNPGTLVHQRPCVTKLRYGYGMHSSFSI